MKSFIEFVMGQEGDRFVCHYNWQLCAIGHYYEEEFSYGPLGAFKPWIFIAQGFPEELREFLSSPFAYNTEYGTAYHLFSYKGLQDFIKDNNLHTGA